MKHADTALTQHNDMFLQWKFAKKAELKISSWNFNKVLARKPCDVRQRNDCIEIKQATQGVLMWLKMKLKPKYQMLIVGCIVPTYCRYLLKSSLNNFPLSIMKMIFQRLKVVWGKIGSLEDFLFVWIFSIDSYSVIPNFRVLWAIR